MKYLLKIIFTTLLILYCFSNQLKAQNHFQKKISNFRALAINYNSANDVVIYGMDSGGRNLLIFKETNGHVGWSSYLNDTVDYGNSSAQISIKLLTSRQSLIGNQVISGFSMGGFFNYTSRFFEFDSLGNILWEIMTPIYRTCNFFENDDGSYSFFGGLDVAENNGEAIYGKIDTAGTLLEMKKSLLDFPIRGFDLVKKTSDYGYLALGRKYNGNNFETALMKFDSSMNTQFIKRLNTGTDSYGFSFDQISDGSFICLLNSSNDSCYLVKVNARDTSAITLRINKKMYNGLLNVSGSNIFLSYTTATYISGVLRLDTSLNIIHNYSIADSSLQAFISWSKIIDGNFLTILGNSTDSWLIQTDSLFSEACVYDLTQLPTDLIQLPLVDDSIVFDSFGGQSHGFPVEFYFSNPFPQWSDTCFTMINGINDYEKITDVFLFPNPVTQLCLIRIAENEKIITINAFNLIGQKESMEFRIQNNGEASANVSRQKPGIYLLEIITEKNKYIKKLIKE